jgi:hypothetical protein
MVGDCPTMMSQQGKRELFAEVQQLPFVLRHYALQYLKQAALPSAETPL